MSVVACLSGGEEIRMKTEIEEDSDELEYPQELFSAVDLLSLQFLVSMVSFGRISPNRFLSSILLVVVIIVTVVIVVVILVVVIFAIVEVVIVVVVVRLACSIPIRWAYAFHQDKASSVKVPVVNVTLFSSAHLLLENTVSVRVPVRLLALAMAAVCASRAAVKSTVSCRMASKVMAGVSDVDVLLGGILSTKDNTDKDGDNDANGGNDDKLETIRYETGLPL
ncbi:hypothetical protein Tco_0052781 [Tanacetum coccineum]